MSAAQRLTLLGEVQACRKCPHGSTRKQVVFAKGDPLSTVAFVGEAPGADEDEQGLPFVGAAGQYLDGMITAMREHASAEGIAFPDDLYFCNVLKCRPPGNKLLADHSDVDACASWLWKQLALLPNLRVVVCVGKTACVAFIGAKDGSIPPRKDMTMSWLRMHAHVETVGMQPANYDLISRGVRGYPVYHSSYLLRQPNNAALRLEAWEDLKLALEALR